MQGAFKEGLDRAQNIPDDVELQQKILEADEGETFDVYLTKEDAEDPAFIEGMKDNLSQGIPVEEYSDEELVRVICEEEEEEVVKVLVTKQGSVRLSTPSKCQTRAMARETERCRMEALKEEMEVDNIIRQALNIEDPEPVSGLLAASQEFNVEGANPDMLEIPGSQEGEDSEGGIEIEMGEAEYKAKQDLLASIHAVHPLSERDAKGKLVVIDLRQ